MQLPKGIFNYLLSKEIMAEYSKMEAILHHARKAEEGINRQQHGTTQDVS